MDPKYIVALELAGSQVRGALASVDTSRADATARILAIETVDQTSNSVQYGRVQNLIEATNAAGVVLQKLENNAAIRSGKITRAYVALGGRSMSSKQATAELSFASECEVTPEILKRLQDEALKTISAEKRPLALLPLRYQVDNQPAEKPVGSLASRLKGEFTVVTCSPANRRNLELVFDERLHLPTDFITAPLALADMVLSEEEKQLGCILVDIGAQTTTVSIYKDRSLRYLQCLPIGSHNITRDIATGMNITREAAEEAKCRQGNAIAEAATANTDAARVNAYTQARAGEIIANIIAQIDYAGMKTQDIAAGIIITGRGAKLRNFARLLENTSKLHVRLAAAPHWILGSIPADSAADFLTLISVVGRAAAQGAASCVTFPQATPAEPIEITTTTDVPGDTDLDDSRLLEDDPTDEEPKPVDKKKKKTERTRRRSILDKLGDIITNLSTPPDSDDTDLDSN